MERTGADYADRLTDADLALLADASGKGHQPGGLRRDNDSIHALLERPEVFDAVFGPGSVARRSSLPISPFLAFAIIVHRAAGDLASSTHVAERAGMRQRLPLFDAAQLAAFLSSSSRRFFLAELLASFTAAGGDYRVRTAQGWKWRRLAETDLVRFARSLEAVDAAERPGLFRRLGDVALFLAGVFPDNAYAGGLGLVDAARLIRASGVAPPDEHARLAASPAMDLFEYLGPRWYRTACRLARHPTAQLAVVEDVAERFRQARRVLNHIADRYLFPV